MARNKPAIAVTLGLLLLLTTGLLSASTIGGYNLDWWTIDSGGAMFTSGGEFTLGGTIGQYDAGVMTGGDYVLHGGFWNNAQGLQGQYTVYLPLVLR